MSDPARRGRKFPLRLDAVAGGTVAKRAVLHPQAPVLHAKRDATQQRTPSGLGLDSADVRKRMAARLREAGPGTDFHATSNGEISITPLHVDLTDHASLPAWRDWASGTG